MCRVYTLLPIGIIFRTSFDFADAALRTNDIINFILLQQQALKSIAAGDQLPLHFEPQVALLCDQKSGQMYYNQYMSETGRWTSDINSGAGSTPSTSCLNEKLDILEYCKKVRQTSMGRRDTQPNTRSLLVFLFCAR